MRFVSILIAALAMQIGSVRAQGNCGPITAPCELENGFYHAAPVDDAKGAIVFLHGWGGTGRGVMRNNGLRRSVNERGYTFVAPQGRPRRPGDKGGSWNSTMRGSRRDDIVFLGLVADDVAKRFDVPREKVLLGGFSGGAMMSWRVGCEKPGSFAAYVPIAGLLWRPLPAACDGALRMLHTHGWSDPIVPLEGRMVGGGVLTQGNLFFGLDIMRDANGCVEDKPDGFGVKGDFQLRRWTRCIQGSALEMALHPGGHTVPKGWAALALDWFEALPE